MAKAVFAIAKTQAQAVDLVEQLKLAGFSNKDISVLLPDTAETTNFAHEQHTKVPEPDIAEATAEAMVGGVFGWLMGGGPLAISGLGPFFAAGPLMAALSGMGAGALAGGLTSTLVGMGIPEYEALHYETRLQEGNILMSVHTDDSSERDRARRIFSANGAADISSSEEASVSDSNKSKTTS
ncbi:MAG: hypothetical protein JO166_02250 [Deltaproteobacteria bacterium]|nr:hypothetical protein [Deltaproteobacteria bacterium]